MNSDLKTSVFDQLIIAFLAGLLFFTALGGTHLWDQDEAFFAGSAAEMWRAGDWVVPHFNGEVFSHKPPWMFWMMMLGYGIWGETAFAARFFSAVFGIGTALLTYHFARQWFNRQVALWSGLAMGSMLMFSVVSRAASPDAYLTFFSALAIGLLVRPPRSETSSATHHLIPPAKKPTSDSATTNASSSAFSPADLIAASPLRWAAAYLAMGFAVLVKGPIGFLLPMAVVGLYLMLSRPLAESPGQQQSWFARLIRHTAWASPLNFWNCLWALKPLRGTCLMLLVAAPWYIAVNVQTGGVFLAEFIGVHHFGRFTGAMDNHSGSLFYYVPALLIGAFPWSILLVPAVILFRTEMLTERSQSARGTTLLLSWVAVYLGFFSLAATKLPSYVLPAYPAVAMACGLCLAGLLAQREAVWRWWPRIAFSVWIGLGVSVCVGFPLIASWTVGNASLLGSYGLAPELDGLLWELFPLGLVPLVGGAICLLLWETERHRLAMRAFAGSCTLILLATIVYAPLKIDRLQNSHLLVESAMQNLGDEVQLGQAGVFRPSLIYYGARPIQKLNGTEEVAGFLRDSRGAVFIREETLAQVEGELGYKLSVIGSQPRFPKQGRVFVVTSTPAIAKQPSGTKVR